MSAAFNYPQSGARRSIAVDAREYRWLAPDGFAIRRIDRRVDKDGASQPAVRGSLLFMPGRGDAYEKWLESLEQWHRQGWNVTSADWRGQAGSGRLGAQATTGHIDDFATWVDDYAALWADWAATTPAPHVAIAHSMGGHIVLRAVAQGKVRPDAVVLSAPMLGIHPAWVPSSALHMIARAIAGIGDRRRPAWKGSEKPELLPLDRSVLLTHDADRYADELWWRAQRPVIGMGPASWGWVERALASIRLLERPGVLEAIEAPVLLLATRFDGLVSWPGIRRAARRIPGAQLEVYGRECRHEILREVDAVRDRAMNAIREFLDRVAPARG